MFAKCDIKVYQHNTSYAQINWWSNDDVLSTIVVLYKMLSHHENPSMFLTNNCILLNFDQANMERGFYRLYLE
jgi:hypothetical protein